MGRASADPDQAHRAEAAVAIEVDLQPPGRKRHRLAGPARLRIEVGGHFRHQGPELFEADVVNDQPGTRDEHAQRDDQTEAQDQHRPAPRRAAGGRTYQRDRADGHQADEARTEENAVPDPRDGERSAAEVNPSQGEKVDPEWEERGPERERVEQAVHRVALLARASGATNGHPSEEQQPGRLDQGRQRQADREPGRLPR